MARIEDVIEVEERLVLGESNKAETEFSKLKEDPVDYGMSTLLTLGIGVASLVVFLPLGCFLMWVTFELLSRF